MKKLFVLVIFMLFIQCNHKYEYSQSENLRGTWFKKQTLDFEVNIKNKNKKNITFVVRNNDTYPYSNIYLFTQIKQGDKIIKTDTLNYELAESNGEWKGTGIGSIKEINLEFKKDYQFPEIGKYTISVIHGMRKDTLKGIEDFGINIQ